MIGLIAAIVSAANAADDDSKGDAQKTFARMEAALRNAKTLECNFDVVAQACPGGSAKGSFALSGNNKFRLDMNSPTKRTSGKAAQISDGTKLATIEGNVTQQIHDVPKWYGEAMKTGFARAGVLLTRFAPLPLEEKDAKIDELFQASDFELSAENAAVGSHTALLIQYKLVTIGLEDEVGKKAFRVKLWVDAKTNLPVKRVVVPATDDFDFTLTETYHDVTLDGKLEAPRFELPNK